VEMLSVKERPAGKRESERESSVGFHADLLIQRRSRKKKKSHVSIGMF
jgi:hypothetical protein